MAAGTFPRFLALLGLLVSTASCHQATRVSRLPIEREPILSVLTFNVNYAQAGDQKTLDAIISHPADLVFLQETNQEWQQQAQSRLGTLYPHQRWLDWPRAGGQAVLSKRPFVVRQVIPSPTGWFPAVRVVAETPIGNVQVLGVHLHPQITEHGSWILGYFFTDAARHQEIVKYVTTLKEPLPTLIVGDFNEGTGGAALRFLEDRGFRSALPEFFPEETTWHWPLGGLELTGQLDHLTYDTALEPLTAAVIRAGSSDHFPVRALFTRAVANNARPRAPRGAPLLLGFPADRR